MNSSSENYPEQKDCSTLLRIIFSEQMLINRTKKVF